MISEGYGDAHTIERRIARMEEWLANPVLLKADKKAQYSQVIEIDLNELKEPVLALPNDTDASALLSEVASAQCQIKCQLSLASSQQVIEIDLNGGGGTS